MFFTRMSTYEPEIIAYISGLTTPLSSGQVILLNTFVRQLKRELGISSLSDYFDFMYILANETEEAALRNIVKRAHDGVAYGSPTFAALEGYTGGMENKYIDTNYNGNSQASAMSVNSASIGSYCRTNVLEAGYSIGAYDGQNVFITSINNRNDTNEMNVLVNQGGSFSSPPSNSDSRGMIIVSKTGSGVSEIYKNGSSIGTRTSSTDGIPNSNIFVLSRNTNGRSKTPTTRQVSFAFEGKGLTSGEVAIIYNKFQAYMTANGKQV